MKVTPELLPVIEWWEKDGKQTVIYLLIAAVVVAGFYAVKNHRIAVRAAARDALVNAYTLEEIEDAAVKFKGTPTAGAIRLRLAKKYYDDGKYADAMSAYEELLAEPVDGFEDIPVVGKAQCLEALGKFAEAQKAFDDFAAKNTNSYLRLTAQLGAARALAQAGDKAGAIKRLEALKAEIKEENIEKARIEATLSTVKRYEKPVAAKPAEAKPVDVKPASPKPAVKPVASKPAEVKPAEVKPAAKPAAPVKPIAPAKPAEAKK